MENKIDNADQIVLGSGDIYMAEFKPGVIPEDETIEVDENRAGNIKGGAALEYTPSYQTVEDDQGRVKKVILTKEETTFKTGMLTWAENWIHAMLPTARLDKSTKEGHNIWKIGGLKNQNGKSYLFRFVHTRSDGRKLRLTITGKNTGALSIKFDPENPTTIDGEITCSPVDTEGTLVIIDDQLTPSPAAASAQENTAQEQKADPVQKK